MVVGTGHESQILDQRKQRSLTLPQVSSVWWAFRPSGSSLLIRPQLCLKIHFITRQSKERQLGNCMPWLKTSGRWFLKEFRPDHGGVRLAPTSWEWEVVVSDTAASGIRVGEGCRKARGRDIAIHVDLEGKDRH